MGTVRLKDGSTSVARVKGDRGRGYGAGKNIAVPDGPLARWTEAMLSGDFERAWKVADEVQLLPGARPHGLNEIPRHLVWGGSRFDGRHVLVRCEHGLGDTVQFVRYLPRLRQHAKRVILKAQPALLPILEGISGADVLLNGWTHDPDPDHDAAIECMELPYAFRSTLATLPAAVPYLSIDRIRALAKPLDFAGEGTCKVGLVWGSSSWNSSRSLLLRQLAPLGCIDRVTFYSLQQGPERAELADSPFPIVNLSPATEGIREAAAAMLAMDLVISVDAMPAHLAGALGRPVWTLLIHAADWRWLRDRDDSPWYPTMRLFRQRVPGDWEPVVAQVAERLEDFVSASSAPRSPASASAAEIWER
jgi:hypothetical protein